MTRPAPDREVPEGYELVAVEDRSWRLVSGKRCRWYGGGYFQATCGAPAVAELDRDRTGRRPKWWAYCPDHLYGRWIENGQVMHWILREIGDDDG